MQNLDTFSAKSSYAACEKEIHISNRFVIHSAQKKEYTACISNLDLFTNTGLAIPLYFACFC